MRGVQLPVNPPILPMLAKRVSELPEDDDGSWLFEPKWDGFRALVFRDGDEILIQSRDGKSLNRYFPELLKPLETQLPARCVLDGEIVIATNRGCAEFAHSCGDFVRIRPVTHYITQADHMIPAPFRRVEGGFQGR